MKQKDLLGLRNLCMEEILEILELAKIMKAKLQNRDFGKVLKNYSCATLFYENSTRTKMSFMLAVEYLGGIVQDLGVSTSSVSKGESLLDTALNIDKMGVDSIIVRHSSTGVPSLLAKSVKASIINAGDGTNEHPTQALLDMYTILEKKGTLKDLNVAIVGDIDNSRVARSNIFGLNKFGANLTLTGPNTLVSKSLECLGAKVDYNVPKVVKEADVVIFLRVQKERQKVSAFGSFSEYSQFFGMNEELLSLCKEDVLVMHPGPVNRGVELTREVIESGNSSILQQVTNGVAVRMAVIESLNRR